MLERFKRGLMVGIFAPVDEQADIVFSRIVTRLTSEQAQEMLLDPEIDERVEGKSKRSCAQGRLVLPPPDRQPQGQDRGRLLSRHRDR